MKDPSFPRTAPEPDGVPQADGVAQPGGATQPGGVPPSGGATQPGGFPQPEAAAQSSGPRPYGRALVASIVALVLAVGVGGWLLGTLAQRTGYPTELSAEAGFARDMQTHHLQAVQMSLIVRDRSQNDDVRAIAYDIATTQQQQAGQMFAWLQLWGLPQTGDRPAMAWMEDLVVESSSHDTHSGSPDPSASPHWPVSGLEASAGHTMESMGMASPEDIARLEAASGSEADRIYLELMIRHHQGGVQMAQAALDRASNPHVLDLAGKMVAAQSTEINALQGLLDRIG
jgi:uncharacterized protein (DUF305 family)